MILQMFYFAFYKEMLMKKKKFQAKNTQIFYLLQFFFIKTSLSDLNLGFKLYFLLFCQVFIYNIYIFL